MTICSTDRFGFMYEPGNEKEVCILFGTLMPYIGGALQKLGFSASQCYLDEYTDGDPDCILLADRKKVRVEFERYSSNFEDHGHDPENCDLIVCWKHTWYSCPKRIRVLALEDVVSRLASEKGPRIIINPRPKYPDRGGKPWSIEEFMDKLRENLPDPDYQQLKAFIDELSTKEGLELKTGRGRKTPTLNIGFDILRKAGYLGYPIGIEATGKASIGYFNVNAPRPYPPQMDKEKAEKVRMLLGEPDKLWHNIKASSVAELIDKLRRVMDALQ